jgi:hypothetical protein
VKLGGGWDSEPLSAFSSFLKNDVASEPVSGCKSTVLIAVRFTVVIRVDEGKILLIFSK